MARLPRMSMGLTRLSTQPITRHPEDQDSPMAMGQEPAGQVAHRGGPPDDGAPTTGITLAGTMTVPQKAGWGTRRTGKTPPLPAIPWVKATITVPHRVALMVASVSARIISLLCSGQRGELFHVPDKVIPLQEHEKGHKQHQGQVEKEDGEAGQHADSVVVDERRWHWSAPCGRFLRA